MIKMKAFCLMLLQFSSILCIDSSLKYYKNDMNPEMEKFVVSQALYFSVNEKDLNTIGKKVSLEMDKKFGNGWICFAGVNGNFSGFDVGSEKNTFIWFSYNENHFIAFKRATDTSIGNEVLFFQLILIGKNLFFNISYRF
jgi:hypothetical protein